MGSEFKTGINNEKGVKKSICSDFCAASISALRLSHPQTKCTSVFAWHQQTAP